MGLDIIPFLEDHVCLIAHGSYAFKWKLRYGGEITQQDKSNLSKKVRKQDAHDQLEKVLRAVIYRLERDMPVESVQTKHFVVNPAMSRWKVADMVTFKLEDKILKNYPQCIVFNVKCKLLAKEVEENYLSSRKQFNVEKNSAAGPTYHCQAQSRDQGNDSVITTQYPAMSCSPLFREGRCLNLADSLKRKPNLLDILHKKTEKRLVDVNLNLNGSPSTLRSRSLHNLGGIQGKDSYLDNINTNHCRQSGISFGQQGDHLTEKERRNKTTHLLKHVMGSEHEEPKEANKKHDTSVTKHQQESQMYGKKTYEKPNTRSVIACIRKDRHLRAQCSKVKDLTPDSTSQWSPTGKKNPLLSNRNCLELRDCEMAEIYEDGSILSPQVKASSHGKRRRKRVYDSNSDTDSESNSDNGNSFSQNESSITRTAGLKMKSKRKLFSDDCVSWENFKNPEIKGRSMWNQSELDGQKPLKSPVTRSYLKHDLEANGKEIVSHYGKILNNGRSLSAKKQTNSDKAAETCNTNFVPAKLNEDGESSCGSERRKIVCDVTPESQPATVCSDKTDRSVQNYVNSASPSKQRYNLRSSPGNATKNYVNSASPSKQRYNLRSSPGNADESSNTRPEVNLTRKLLCREKKLSQISFSTPRLRKTMSGSCAKRKLSYSSGSKHKHRDFGQYKTKNHFSSFKKAVKLKRRSKISLLGSKSKPSLSSTTDSKKQQANTSKSSSAPSTPTGNHHRERLNVPDSVSHQQALKQARARLMTAKDGVWLLGTSMRLTRSKSVERYQEPKSQSGDFSRAKIPAHSSNKRLTRSASTMSSLSPKLSAPPKTSSSCSKVHQLRRASSQPSKFWQVMGYLFGSSS